MRTLSEPALLIGWRAEIALGIARGRLRCVGGRAVNPRDGFPGSDGGGALTQQETRVAEHLYQYNFCSRPTLDAIDEGDARKRSLDTVIYEIRKRLPEGAIETVRRQGYRLKPEGRPFVADLLGKAEDEIS